MRRLTRISLSIAFVLTLLAPAALAQEERPCFGLDAADCARFYSPGPAAFTNF